MQLQFFNTPEGYVEPTVEAGVRTEKSVKGFDTSTGTITYSDYKYVYQYTDIWNNVRLSYSDADLNGAIDPNTEIIQERNFYPFGLVHKGYNSVVNGTENNHNTYQGQEISKELGYNMLEFRYRHYDPSIGRFVTIDPLAEDYTYNSTYAFQENKLGMGIELEGAELLVHDIALYLNLKYQQWKSNVSGHQSNLHKAIGSVEAHRTGQERSNVTVGNINVNQVHDASVISESVNGIASETANTGKQIARDAADGLETTGDYITYFGIATGQPEIIAAGEVISGIGTGINVSIDLMEGEKSYGQIVIENGSQVVFGKLSEKALDALKKNGSYNTVVESIIKANEITFSEITDHIIEKLQQDNTTVIEGKQD
jgi:RHS repeat-associated protein